MQRFKYSFVGTELYSNSNYIAMPIFFSNGLHYDIIKAGT